MANADSDRRFIESRTERRKFGLIVLPSLLVLIVVAWGLFFAFLPLTVNPWYVLGRIESNTLQPGTLTMYAMTATALVNVIFALLVAFVIVTMVWAKHERRYLKLLAASQREGSATAQKAQPLPTDGSGAGRV